jgi:NADH-quinone oxidoreductase subunit A
VALWPLAVFLAAVVFIAVLLVVLSHFAGERHSGPARDIPYESGIPPTGSARLRLSVRFYQVAMFFLIFDLEAAFIAAWAIALRAVGWTGYVVFVIFAAVLLVGLAYIWREGALDWGPRTGQRRRR